MKKLIAAVCGIAVLMLAVPSLFAQSSVPMVAPPVPAGEYKSDMMSTFNFNVTATDYVKPSKLFFSADYSLENSESREAALNKLNEFFNKAKTEIEKYGTIVTYNVNVYGSMPYYEKMDSQPVTQSVYSGNLNIRIEMGNIDNYEALRNSLIKNGFNYWTDAVVAEEAKIDIEMKNADHLKTLIDKKKGVYEKILGYPLKRISSLYISTWPDGSSFNPTTKMVPVNVSVDVSLSAE